MWQGRIWPPTTFSIFYWLLSKTCSVTSAPQSWDSEMRYSSAVWHGFALPVRLTAPMPYSANSAVVVKMFRGLRQVFKLSSSLFRISTTQEENVQIHMTWRTRFVFNPGHRRVQDLSLFVLFVCWSNICTHQPNESVKEVFPKNFISQTSIDETTTIRKWGGIVFFKSGKFQPPFSHHQGSVENDRSFKTNHSRLWEAKYIKCQHVMQCLQFNLLSTMLSHIQSTIIRLFKTNNFIQCTQKMKQTPAAVVPEFPP